MIKFIRFVVLLMGFSSFLWAEDGIILPNFDTQKIANSVISIIGYSLTPDVTTGQLSLQNDSTGNPNLNTLSFGGGFTVSKEYPIYLEGTGGYSRYDPVFIASNGEDERKIPMKWNSISATVGIGWDFHITDVLVFRPIINGSLGYVATDTAISREIFENRSDKEIAFLNGGDLKTYGLGGTLMLDVEDYTPEREIDIELRYTDIHLQSYGDTATAIQGSADATTLSLWTRWRAPTDIVLFHRPVRYVLEWARTEFYGDLDGTLGFDALTSFGAGLELDTSKDDIFITRTRLLVRHMFGSNISGTYLSIAISF